MFGKSHKYEPRLTGRTTRQVDQYVQEFFETGDITIKDHYDNGNNKTANSLITERVFKRLQIEHNGLVHMGTVHRDKSLNRIWFVPKIK